MRVLAILTCAFWATTAAAQSTSDEDRGYITGLIEDAISNDNMTVRLNGFRGALSSEATADSITIADPEGIWLQLDDLVFSWSRSDLLSGRVEVEELSAGRIELIRLPAPSAAQSDLPSAEATPFSLPDLPVSVNIGDIAAGEIILPEALLGEPITARFQGDLTLEGGAGAANLLLERTDGKTGVFEIASSYDNESRQLALDLLAEEGQNGIAARLLDLPDRPSLRLSVLGDAPLDDFSSQIALATDGQDRVTGTVEVRQLPQTQDRAFLLDLSGDLRPLFVDQYDPFFGASSVLRVEGAAFASGALSLTELALTTEQLSLAGQARTDTEGWPELIDLQGRLQTPDGSRVLLPLSDPATEVSGVTLNVTYDAAEGDAWTGAFDITSLTREGLSVDALALSGGGVIVQGAGTAQGRFTADLSYAARGLDLGDAALNEALGDTINGTLDFGRIEDGPFVIEGLTLSGAGIEAQGQAVIEGPDGRFQSRGDVIVTADDFSRFAGLSGLDLNGGGRVDLGGTVQPFDGIFELSLRAITEGLKVGIAEVDPLLQGRTVVEAELERDLDGTRIPRLEINSPALTAQGQGELTSDSASGSIQAQIIDAGLVVPELSGPVALDAEVATDAQNVVSLDLSAAAPAATLRMNGTATPQEEGYLLRSLADIAVNDLRAYGNLLGQTLRGAVAVTLDGTLATATGVLDADVSTRTTNLGVGSPVADRILAGLGRIDADVSLSEAGRLRLDALDVAFPNLTASGTIASSGADTVAELTARLRDISLLVSDFSGPVVAELSARQDAGGWQITSRADGPVGTNAQVSGRVGNDGTLALGVTGSAPLQLANLYIAPRQVTGRASFNLSVDGPPALSSVRGPIRIDGGRFTAPTFGQALEDLNGTLQLAGGTLRIDLGAASAAGGTVQLTGPVDLSAPFQAALRAQLAGIVIRDPELYQTTANGAITVDGPLAGGARIAGQIDLGQVDVQVPSTGVSALGSLPEVTHIGPRLEVLRTLDRAGLGPTPQSETDPSASGPAYPIDLLIRAPSRIFVRGRGLDAELGGQLQLTGTTDNIIPIGRFDLTRGRLNILGQRFELNEGFAQLQGDFSPFLRLVARTETPGGTIVSIIVEGEPDDIDVRFESTPELPQDEVLAQLLFGRDLSSISPLQAVQLASAVATLAGNGNGGVINSFRQDLDLDDLDIITDEEGNAAVRAGKYISENVYTDVTVGSGGDTEINLNIDIDRNFTARGTVTSDGETSVGIFFERDY